MKTNHFNIYAAIVASVAFLLYMPAVNGGFAWDEINILFSSSDFLPFYGFKYHRPLFSSMLALEQAIFRGNPVFSHMLSSLFHAGSSLMVLFVARRLLKSDYAAFISALLFALHPVNSEAVAWVFARSEIVKTFFVLISLHLYLMYREDRRLPALLASVLFYLLACLSGQGALVFPLAILAYEILIGDGLKGSRIPLSAYSAAAAIYLLAFRGAGEIVSFVGAPGVNIYESVVSLGYYALKLVLPLGLGFLPALPDEPYSLVISLALLALPFLMKREWKEEKFLLLFILIMLLPPMLIAMSGASHFLGLRYMYAASAGYAMLAGHFLARIPNRGVLIALVVLLAALFVAGSLQRAIVWGDRVGVWTEAASESRGDSLVNINLAVSLVSADRAEDAKPALYKALAAPGISSSEFRWVMKLLYEISPGNDQDMFEFLSEIKGPSRAYLGMGFYYFDRYSKSDPKDKGMLMKSIKYLGKSAESEPSLIIARYYLGLSYMESGEIDPAIEEFKAVETMDTTGRYSSDAAYYLGLIQKLEALPSDRLEFKLK